MTFGSSSYNANPDVVSESTGLRDYKENNFWKRIGCYGNTDGFTVISSCFFVLTVAITFALVIQIYYGSPEVTPHGAIATDERLCSEIGLDLMRKGGNSADVAIASLLCLSVTHPHLAGAGGGGIAIVHDHKLNSSKIIDFMSGVPYGLEDYVGSIDSNDGRSIGIPGFLKGLGYIYYHYGTLPWKDLVSPSASLARNGFPVSQSLWNELSKEQIVSSTVMGDTFLKKGVLVAQGERLRRKSYATFLEDVAQGGADEFYLLKYASEVIDAMQTSGSKVSTYDLHSYRVLERDLLHTKIRNFTIVSAGPPFGGLQALAGLRYISNAKIGPHLPDTKLYELFAESIANGGKKVKAYESNSNLTYEDLLNDTFVPHYDEDESFDEFLRDLPATQVSAVDASDLYVSVVVGLGTNFGSRVMTEHGILLNNHLFNFYRTSKQAVSNEKRVEDSNEKDHLRPLSPYTPMLIMDSNNVCGKRIVLSSGSSSASLQVASHLMYRGLGMAAAIVEPRIAMGPGREILVNDMEPLAQRLSGEVREYLKTLNYTVKLLYTPISVNGVKKRSDEIVSHSDTRGGGVAARLNGMGDLGKVGAEDGVRNIHGSVPFGAKVLTSDASNVATIHVSDGVNIGES